MKRIGLIAMAGLFGIAASLSVGIRYAGGQHPIMNGGSAAGWPAVASGRLEALRHQSGTFSFHSTHNVVGPLPKEHKSDADATLRAFMSARMRRNAAVAKQYLSARAYSQLCDDPVCIRVIGVSNPHYAAWDLVSRTDEGAGRVRFVVRIYEAVTGQGETDQFRQTLEIGPGENYFGQRQDAVVLSVS